VRSCIFCRIVAGDAPAQQVYEDDRVIAFHDAFPKAPFHVLIVPRRHIPSLAHVTPEDEPLLGHLLYVARLVAEKEGILEEGFRVIINTGAGGGQEVYHLHLHVMARFRGHRPQHRDR